MYQGWPDVVLVPHLDLFRGERLNREIDEELRAHLEEAVAHGRDAEETRRAFGSLIRVRGDSRELLPFLDSLRANVVFGWRQLNKHRPASAASVLSLAIGAATRLGGLVATDYLREPRQSDDRTGAR